MANDDEIKNKLPPYPGGPLHDPGPRPLHERSPFPEDLEPGAIETRPPDAVYTDERGTHGVHLRMPASPFVTLREDEREVAPEEVAARRDLPRHLFAVPGLTNNADNGLSEIVSKGRERLVAGTKTSQRMALPGGGHITLVMSDVLQPGEFMLIAHDGRGRVTDAVRARTEPAPQVSAGGEALYECPSCKISTRQSSVCGFCGAKR